MEIRKNSGFSLIEVVIATGIFAGGIVAVLFVVSGLGSAGAEIADRHAAARLVDDIREELLRREARVVAGEGETRLDAFTALFADKGLYFWSSKDGTRIVQSEELREAQGAVASDRYFSAEVQAETGAKVAKGCGFLGVSVIVHWPGGLETARSSLKSRLVFTP